MSKVTLATNYDDWEGLYIDGVLFTQGHQIRLQDLARALGINIEEVACSDYLGKYGNLPNSIDDLNDE